MTQVSENTIGRQTFFTGAGIFRIFAAVTLCTGIAALSRFPFDDAFIHMRIARNLAFDGQPYFNLGQQVMGGSSPLWLLIVSAMFRVANHPAPVLVVVLECVLVVALAIVVEAWLALATGRSLLTAALSFLLVAGLALMSAGFLMEPALALLLAVAGVLALARGNAIVAGLALGLAAATRYEMGLLAGISWLATPGLRNRGRFLVGFLPVLLGESILLWSWYGTVVPNTVRAKSIAYPLTFSQFLLGVPGLPFLQMAIVVAWVLGAAGCATLAFVQLRSLPEERVPLSRSVVVFGAFGAALFIAYAARRTFMFTWYWPNVTFPSALAAAGTWIQLWAARARNGSAPLLGGVAKRSAYAAVGLVGLASLPIVARTANMVMNALLNRPAHSGSLFANLRTDTYRSLGEQLFRACPNGVVLTSEIGAIGWTFRSGIVDGMGLVSPEVLRYHPLRVPEQRSSETIGAIPARAVADLQPDLVVGMELFLSDFLSQRATVPELARYRLVEARPVIVDHGVARPLWNSSSILVFARPDGCVGPKSL